jgi:DNA-3-methyladenine glycosylase
MGGKRFRKLSRAFYERPTLEVAPDILGKYIVYNSPQGKLSARIVEVEAYIGQDDPACHAARGKTKRNEVMFGLPGFTYIYFIYGMYYCLNFVTEPEGSPAALLLRAAEPDEGVAIMERNSRKRNGYELLNGPGKFCRSFGLTRRQNGIDLTGDLIYLEDRFNRVKNIVRARRVGIKNGTERLWRFYDKDSKAVSRLE